jgi:hypothetical protein
MCYVKYEQEIIIKHKVKLVGWPTSIKFANPSDIGTVGNIRKLRQTLKTGECKWIVQSRGQQAAYAEMLAGKVAAGEQVVKKRKERSDKGKTREKGSKKAVTGKSGKGGRNAGGDNARGSGASEGGDNDDKEPRLPRKKRKHATAAKARVEKKLPPALKSKEFVVDSNDDNNDE